MFCNKCGYQLSDDVLFCPKCGEKVPDKANSYSQSNTSVTGDEAMLDELDVTLTNVGVNKVKVIKTVQEWIGLGLKEARDMVEHTPVLLKKGVTMEEAESVKETFMKVGATVTFTDQKGNSVDVDTDQSEPISAEASFAGMKGTDLLSVFKDMLKKSFDDFKRMSTAWKILIALGILFVVGFVIFLLTALLRLIFSSIISVIVTAAIGYIVYQRWVAVWITDYIYTTKYENEKLQLPEEMTTQTLLEALSGKFNYPYFQGVRYGENGECIIEGKYSVYTVDFDKNNAAYLICNPYNDKKQRTILLEAIAIQNYINKFFNPTMTIDVTKDLKKLKSAEKQRKMVSGVVSVASFLVIAAIVLESTLPGGLGKIMKPGMEVREAYLSQYSETVTIEEAFDNFFENGKWRKYKEEDYTYIAFTGVCEYMGERADVKVTFKITGENFIIDSMDINGQAQNDLMIYALLSKIYEN